MANFWDNDPVVNGGSGDDTTAPATTDFSSNDPIVSPSQTGAGDPTNPMSIHKSAPPASSQYTPSAIPWLDPVSAFANKAIESIPIVGGPLEQGVTNLDATLNNALGFEPETPEQRAQINSATEQQFPAASVAGTVTGTVAPFVAAGGTELGAKLLGMSGSLPARIATGAASGSVINAADTATRGGSGNDIRDAAIGGGALGLAAPIAGKVIGGIWNGIKGPGMPQVLARALTDDGIPLNEVNQRLADLGPGATIADLGPNTAQVAGALASVPGEPQAILKNAYGTRAAQAGQRLTNDIANTLGTGTPGFSDQIIAAQKAAADPLYAAVRNVPVQMTPELQELAARPWVKKALGAAATTMQNDGLRPTTTVQLFDYAKQALDDQASAAIRSGESNKARIFSGLSAQLRNAIDQQVPAYAQARDAFAGPARVMDAVDLGQSVFTRKMSPAQLQQEIAGMSTSEKDGLLQGAQSAIQDMMGNARTDAAGIQQAFRSSNAKAKLATLIGPDAAQQVSDALDREAKFASTNNTVTGNSVTAARQAAQRAIAPEQAAFPNMTNQTTALGAALAGIQKARNLLTAGYRASTNRQLANVISKGALTPYQGARLAAVQNPKSLVAPVAVPLLANRAQIDPVKSALTLAGVQ